MQAASTLLLTPGRCLPLLFHDPGLRRFADLPVVPVEPLGACWCSALRRSSCCVCVYDVQDPELLRFIDLECFLWSTVNADLTPLINAGMVFCDRHYGGINYPVSMGQHARCSWLRVLPRPWPPLLLAVLLLVVVQLLLVSLHPGSAGVVGGAVGTAVDPPQRLYSLALQHHSTR